MPTRWPITTTTRHHARSCYERLKDFTSLAEGGVRVRRLRRGREDVRTAASRPRRTTPVSLDLDSPVSISKIVGEIYGNYYHSDTGCRRRAAPGSRTCTGRAKSSAPADGAARRPRSGATSRRPSSIRRSRASRCRSRTGALRRATSSTSSDIADGLCAARSRGAPGEVYNLASGVETTIRELADAHQRPHRQRAGHQWLPKRRDWDTSGKRFGSTVKSERELGWRASTPLATGLERTVSWTKDHLDLIQRTIRKHEHHLGAAPPAR